jgi:hypothetical protein
MTSCCLAALGSRSRVPAESSSGISNRNRTQRALRVLRHQYAIRTESTWGAAAALRLWGEYAAVSPGGGYAWLAGGELRAGLLCGTRFSVRRLVIVVAAFEIRFGHSPVSRGDQALNCGHQSLIRNRATMERFKVI